MAPNSFHKIKLWLHTCAFLLMVGALGVALIITMNPVMLGGAKRTPMAARVGMSMAGKGLLFLTYQVLTENVRVCKRFASTKANKILNIIETLAWPAACGVTVYGIMQFCIGISCTLSWVMVPLTAILAVISGFSAWISIKEHARFKATGQKPGDMVLETMNSEDSNKAFNSSANTSAPISQTPSTAKTPTPVYSQSQSYNSQQPRQHYNQRQQDHYQHNQSQHYQQQQQEQQQGYQPQQQQYGNRR